MFWISLQESVGYVLLATLWWDTNVFQLQLLWKTVISMMKKAVAISAKEATLSKVTPVAYRIS